MPETALFPIAQKANLLQSIEEQLRSRIEEEDITSDRAFIHVALDVLGNDFDPSDISDGRGDYGIDFIDVEEHRASIYQFKSQEFNGSIKYDFKAPPSLLGDLSRIKSVLHDLDQIPKEANSRVQAALKKLRAAIERHNKSSSTDLELYAIDVYFVVMACMLTDQAEEEFKKIARSSGEITVQ